jgi:thiamine biosynthesis protein ThiS
MSKGLEIIVNGEPQSIADGATLSDLLAALGLPAERVAVERNREVVRRADWPAIKLAEKDRLEIVHFVGGG